MAAELRPVRLLLAEAAGQVDRLDAEVLLADQLGIERLAMLATPDRLADAAAFRLRLERRRRGEPVAYITGRREFWSLDLLVSPDVLIPRPDSETLIELARSICRARPPATILDLGTGSGALLLAALTVFPQARGVGVDRSPAAVAVALGNARRTGLASRARFVVGHWGEALGQRFDLILANPPYVADGEALPADVGAFEPASALFAGPDGLASFRQILPDLPRLLAAGGTALVEHGAAQQPAVAALAARAGLVARGHRDLAGRPRALELAPAPEAPIGPAPEAPIAPAPEAPIAPAPEASMAPAPEAPIAPAPEAPRGLGKPPRGR